MLYSKRKSPTVIRHKPTTRALTAVLIVIVLTISCTERNTSFITPMQFGAVGDGNTDPSAVHRETQSFLAAVISAGERGVPLQLGGSEFTYAINQLSFPVRQKKLTIDGAGATILAQSSRVFNIRGSSELLQTNILIQNIRFQQEIKDKTDFGNYVFVSEARDITFENNTFEKCGNGAIEIGPTTNDIYIANNRFLGQDDSTVNRAIWLRGTSSDSTQFTSQLIDIETIKRNEHSLNDSNISPTNIRITSNAFIDQQYGIYLMNSRFVDISMNTIEASARCVAVNNYSPHTKIANGTCTVSGSGTGVLVTQASHDVLIENMTFGGDYGGGRAIQVSYLANALIKSNKFPGLGSRDIQIDMGGNATIIDNLFIKGSVEAGRHIYISPLDDHVVANMPDSNFGLAATTVAGSTITNNTFKNRPIVVQINQNTLLHGVVAEMEETVLADNTFIGRNNFRGGGERILNVHNETRGTAWKPVRYRFDSNTVEGVAELTEDFIVYDPNRAFNKPVLQIR